MKALCWSMMNLRIEGSFLTVIANHTFLGLFTWSAEIQHDEGGRETKKKG